MPHEVSVFIIKYGYQAIFLLVFTQEIGIPNPVPNELVLLFSGYLTLKGILYLPFVILVVASADFIATNLLYFTFYFFGIYIIKHKPRWLPISEKKLNTLTQRISKGGLWTIYLCRLTPFIRGYTSVITGLLQIKPKTFLPIALISATIWSTFYIITGKLLGPSFSYIWNTMGGLKFILVIVLLFIILIIAIQYFRKHKNKINKNESKYLL